MVKLYKHSKFQDNGLSLLVENRRRPFLAFVRTCKDISRAISLTVLVLLLSLFGYSQSANIDQARNGPATSPISPVNWVNGNVNASQAHMVEGYSVPYRVIMTGLTVGTPVELDLEYDTRHSGANALDFITG